MAIHRHLATATIFGMSLFASAWPASAFCVLGCAESVQKTAFTVIQQEGVAQSKLITYTANSTTKTVSKKSIDESDTSFFGKTLSTIDKGLYGQQYAAQLVTKVHLGADLKKMTPESFAVSDCIPLSGCKITIRLPQIEVISTELDTKNSSIVDKKEGFLVSNMETANFVQEMFDQKKKMIADDVLNDREHVTKARESLMSTLKGIINKALGDKNNVAFIS